MKKSIHPDNYRPVVYQDISDNTMFLVSSTAASKETIKYTDGKEYPLVSTHIKRNSPVLYRSRKTSWYRRTCW